MKYGIFDTVDQVWLGDEEASGPKLFDTDDPIYQGDPALCAMTARLAAEIVDIRLRQPPHRTIHLEFNETNLREKDRVTPHMSTSEALRKKLRGTVP